MSGATLLTGSYDYRLVTLSVTLALGFLVMMVAIAAAFLDRILAMRRTTANVARDGENRLRMLAEDPADRLDCDSRRGGRLLQSALV